MTNKQPTTKHSHEAQGPRLALRRQTLRVLSAQALGQVVGGYECGSQSGRTC